MYPLLLFHAPGNDSKLPDKIERQKEHGGRLVSYQWAWSLVFFTVLHTRIIHVPHGRSRILAGCRHNLALLLLGIWNPFFWLAMPVLLVRNFQGGIDVTARFSDASVHPLLDRPPDPEAERRDSDRAGWVFVALGLAFAVLWLILNREWL